jgi:hypothetical protein
MQTVRMFTSTAIGEAENCISKQMCYRDCKPIENHAVMILGAVMYSRRTFKLIQSNRVWKQPTKRQIITIIITRSTPPPHDPSPQRPKTPIAKPTPLTPHLTNSTHCCSLALLSTSSPLTSSTSSSTTPCFKRCSMARFRPPLAAATRPVHSK